MNDAVHTTERYLLPQAVGALVTGRVASVLLRRTNLTEVRCQVRGNDPEVDSILMALSIAAARYRNSMAGAADPHPESVDQPVAAPPMGDEWLSVADAAERLDCSTRNVRHILNRGGLVGKRSGRGWVIAPESLNQLLNDRMIGQAS